MKTNPISKLILCAMLLFVSGMAHASIGKIGSCWGQLSANGYSKTGKGRISAAVIIPQSQLKAYDGARITAIRVGLITADGISNLTAWTRQSIEGTNLVEADFDGFSAGWNEQQVTSAQTIDASHDLVVGYSFDQEKSVKAMSVAGNDGDNGYWVAKDDVWQNRSADIEGSLSVELVVEGDMVPAKNLTIESLTVDSTVIQYGNTITASVQVRNTALSDIVGTVDYKYNVGDYWQMTENNEISLAYGEATTVNLYIPTDNLPVDKKLQLNLSAIVDGDGYTSDNNDSLYVSVYNKSVPRKVLLEEFTSEFCSNCPRAIQTIEECMNEGYDEHLIQISHHVGYKDDWLTVEEDTAYEWFYGTNGTFAPAGMLDRTQREEYNASVPVFSIGYADTFRPMLDVAIAQPAFVDVSVWTGYDVFSRKLDINVFVNKLPQLDVLCSEPRLTVILTEDSILHHDQAGYNSQTFRHRHVYRKCISDIWGDTIKWTTTSASCYYQYTLPEEWNEQYVEVVAFVSAYNPNDRNECQVFNSAYMLNDHYYTSVQSVGNDGCAVSQEYFDISGRKLSKMRKGLNIVRTTSKDGTVMTRKLMQ